MVDFIIDEKDAKHVTIAYHSSGFVVTGKSNKINKLLENLRYVTKSSRQLQDQEIVVEIDMFNTVTGESTKESFDPVKILEVNYAPEFNQNFTFPNLTLYRGQPFNFSMTSDMFYD